METEEKTQNLKEDNPQEIGGQTDDGLKEKDNASDDQDSEDVNSDKKCVEADRKDQEPTSEVNDVEAKAEHEPSPPGEGALTVNFAAEECTNNVTFEKQIEPRDCLEDEFLVQEMMTADTAALELAANTGHPVTDTPDGGDLEPPGEEEIEMLEEIPVISIRSGWQLMIIYFNTHCLLQVSE